MGSQSSGDIGNWLIILSFVASLSPAFAQTPIDSDATAETKALFRNLSVLAEKGFLFGHHEDDAYGVGWYGIEGKSDVKDITGSYPAVHGWDLGKIAPGVTLNIDSVDFKKMHTLIEAVYLRGGVNTISWHVDNPVTRKNAWDKTPAVKDVLPGGAEHAYFLKQLDLVADYLIACKSRTAGIPIIFRPWHEHNGNWFWWGKGNCTEAEFIQLWKLTVTYLRDTKKIHHLLYAFSPDRSRMDLKNAEASYAYGYPGDDYVDIIGLDDYKDVGVSENVSDQEQRTNDFVKVLTAISEIAKAKNKIAAVTETGQEGIKNPHWFTEVMLNPLKANGKIHIAYSMMWRNANKKHHYASYPGHSSQTDFLAFYNDPYTLFESDLTNLYR